MLSFGVSALIAVLVVEVVCADTPGILRSLRSFVRAPFVLRTFPPLAGETLAFVP